MCWVKTRTKKKSNSLIISVLISMSKYESTEHILYQLTISLILLYDVLKSEVVLIH